MLFNSLEFALFFPMVVLAYGLAPARTRWSVLLVASYVFYMGWRAEYALLIVASTVVDWFAARGIHRSSTRGRKKAWLAVSLLVNLGLLFFFKYFDFFSRSAAHACDLLGMDYAAPLLDVVLPVGISFYTFQTLSYTIDVYRGEVEPADHLGVFGLYVAFWPQLVAGPIERSSRLLPQLGRLAALDPENMRNGFVRMAWGLFKKVVVADRLAPFVSEIYGHPGDYGAGGTLIGTWFFAFQIYCDFSGYSDIAIGAARVFGVDLMENFRTPYFSQSVREFWQRWHISLSTWFRDYVYIPLGGNRGGPTVWKRNLMITFLVSGLWHGANWTFVVWGFLHGILILGGTILRRYARPRDGFLMSTLRRLIVFNLVCFAWVFFRADSFGDAAALLGALTDLTHPFAFVQPGGGRLNYYLAVMFIGLLIAVELWLRGRTFEDAVRSQNVPVRWAVYVALCLSINWFGVFSANEFIYFQF